MEKDKSDDLLLRSWLWKISRLRIATFVTGREVTGREDFHWSRILLIRFRRSDTCDKSLLMSDNSLLLAVLREVSFFHVFGSVTLEF